MKPNYTSILHSEFLIKVKNFHRKHFQKNPEYSGDFNQDRNKDCFGRSLKENLERETGIENPFNHRTLITIINAGIAPNARQSTLDIIARYTGYENYQDFINKNRSKYQKKSRVKVAVLSGAAFIALVILISYFVSENSNRTVFRIIHEANQAQFEAYQALPEVKTVDLKKYYTETGSAYKVIVDILKRSAELKRVINKPEGNASYYTIHDIRILKKLPGRIVAETQEHWYLRWYCLESQSFVKKYDGTNRQIYILKKENTGWKIEANDFEGTAEEIRE